MKTRHSVSIDDEVWTTAQNLNMNISEFIEKMLLTYIGHEDELTKLMHREAELQKELDIVQLKICQKIDSNRKENNTKNKITKAMITINRIHAQLGCIGKNQIKETAMRNNIRPEELLKHCEKEKLNIEEYGAMPKNFTKW